jgi:hypothetical protein
MPLQEHWNMITRLTAALGAMVGLICAAWPGQAGAAVIVSLNNPGSTTLHEITVTPGETFSIDLNLDTDIHLWWVGTAIGADVSGVFDLVQMIDSPPWSGAATSSAPGGLDPVTDPFETSMPYPESFSTRTAVLATAHLSVEPAADTGSYTLQVVDPMFHDSRFAPVAREPAEPGPTLVVYIVPEPTSFLFAFALACSLGLKRRLAA